MIEKTCCVTGHREIPADKLAYVEMDLRKAIMSAVADGYTRFINGGAAGADLLFAAIVAELKEQGHPLYLEAALPYNVKFFLITKVYLGNRMATEEREKIISICHKRNIPYIGVRRNPLVFEMQDCEIKCEDCPQYKKSKK